MHRKASQKLIRLARAALSAASDPRAENLPIRRRLQDAMCDAGVVALVVDGHLVVDRPAMEATLGWSPISAFPLDQVAGLAVTSC